MSISTDSQKIDWVLHHAVENIFPSREAFRERLMKGERLTIYYGIDPTGPTLHLGHVVTLRKLAELQELGHHIILLIGDFTAMIGDPTDKTATRKQQTREEVLANCKLYKEQASKILSFDGPNAAELKFNSEWLGKMSFADVTELAAHFTVQQMMERDMFEKRMTEGKPIHLHEFLYPLMQGYDSVAMDVDAEVGGNDQMFNMLAGRTLLREMKNKEKFVITGKLLTDPTGKKMGKSEGNMLSLLDAPEDMYGKVLSWTDEMIIPGFEVCTQMTQERVAEIKSSMAQGENPMRWKRELARSIVSWLYGEEAANGAAEHFNRVHQQGKLPELIDIKYVPKINFNMSLPDAMSFARIVDSKSEARRQIEQGAVKVNDEVVRDIKKMLEITSEGVLLQKGPRTFIRLVLEKE